MSLEREVRINQRYTSSIGARRIRYSLSRDGYTYSTFTTKITYLRNNIRIIEDLVSGDIIYRRKVEEWSERPSDLYRIVQSLEEELENVEGVPYEGKISYNLRYRYKVEENLYVDITYRSLVDENTGLTTNTINIELEFRREKSPPQIQKDVRWIMNLHYGWEYGGEIPNFTSVISNMHGQIRNLRPNMLRKPRDITWADMMYDNLIAKPHMVTPKADGERILLAITRMGRFFLTSSLEVDPIDRESIRGENIILDGELVGDTFYISDAITDGDFRERMDFINQSFEEGIIPKSIQHNMPPIHGSEPVYEIWISMKPYWEPTTVDEFFRYNREVLRSDIPHDGIILIPIDQMYSNPVLKWKPVNLLTVDFFIGSNSLYVSDRGLVKSGAEYYSPPRGTIGTVAEFAYMDGKWRYYRSREDKAISNALRVYNTISKLVADPITRETMTGGGMKLMRKYHNRVRNKVYEYIAHGGVHTITDVGSGKGGGMASWALYGFDVRAIEPYGDFVDEFLKRATNMDATYTKIEYMGYDRYEIDGYDWAVSLHHTDVNNYMPNVRTDAVTMFNVATHLDPRDIVEFTDESADDDSYLVITVVDGNILLKNVVDRRLRYIEADYVPCEGGYDLGCVDIALKDTATVAETQREYLVDIDVLDEHLRRAGWKLDTHMIMDDERLLNEEEKLYTEAQTLLIYRKRDIPSEVVKPSYKSLGVNEEQEIASPWNTLKRVGVIQNDDSMAYAIAYSSDPEFRKMDSIDRTIYISQYDGLPPTEHPIYMIPEEVWDIVGADGTIYPATMPYMDRKEGIVIMYVQGSWEPVGKVGPQYTSFIW